MNLPNEKDIGAGVPLSRDEVLLVDEQDRGIGMAPKLAAHENGGQLHRAFSIVVFNKAGQQLIQQRSVKKYHFGGLWTNTCCGHPRRGEVVVDAGRVRLGEEFGFETDLREVFSFTYRAHDPGTGLTEHEFDHVLFGRFDGEPKPNPDEIDDYKWVENTALLEDVERHPERYTPWFRLLLGRVLKAL